LDICEEKAAPTPTTTRTAVEREQEIFDLIVEKEIS